MVAYPLPPEPPVVVNTAWLNKAKGAASDYAWNQAGVTALISIAESLKAIELEMKNQRR